MPAGPVEPWCKHPHKSGPLQVALPHLLFSPRFWLPNIAITYLFIGNRKSLHDTALNWQDQPLPDGWAEPAGG